MWHVNKQLPRPEMRCSTIYRITWICPTPLQTLIRTLKKTIKKHKLHPSLAIMYIEIDQLLTIICAEIILHASACGCKVYLSTPITDHNMHWNKSVSAKGCNTQSSSTITDRNMHWNIRPHQLVAIIHIEVHQLLTVMCTEKSLHQQVAVMCIITVHQVLTIICTEISLHELVAVMCIELHQLLSVACTEMSLLRVGEHWGIPIVQYLHFSHL